jgi:hypothetical protein
MRTVLFREGSPECPLIAIADFESAEVESLQQAVLRLATGKATSASVDGDVILVLISGDRDIGVEDTKGRTFECILRPVVWRQVAELLEPFKAPDQSGYQWLNETGQVRLLISRSGEW